jgi:Ser-tRNA(Ala) deacylase AlaX
MTIPLYLQDAYLKEMEAKIVDVSQEGDRRWQILLDKTIFYPRGGGQSTDQGVLISESWQGKVIQVLQKGTSIIHYVESNDSPPPVRTLLKGRVDWERRYLNMRLHSAGHVIDFISLFKLRRTQTGSHLPSTRIAN